MRYLRLVHLVLGATLTLQAGPILAEAAKFPVKGLVKSGSGSGVGTTPVLVVDSTAAPNTVPGSGKVIVLMQACFRVDPAASVTMSAGAISVSFAASNANGGTGCQTFSPGFVVPEGVDVICAATGTAAYSCTVSGVVAKAQ